MQHETMRHDPNGPSHERMRILLLNPNTTDELTHRLVRVAQGHAGPGVDVVGRTAKRGFPYISSRAEAQLAGGVVLEMIAEEQERFDAVVIAAYGDPGLHAARETLNVPVVGMAEAAMLTACMLGDRFSVVTFSERLVPWFREGVLLGRMEGRLASVRALSGPVASLADVAERLREPLVDLCRKSADDGADVAILAGAPLAGLAQRVALDVPLVTLDPISAAIAQACALVSVAPKGASRGSYGRPPRKQSKGLDAPLTALL